MRASPLGVAGWCWQPAVLADAAEADASLSHPDPLCVAANVVFTHAVARAVRTGEAPRDLHGASLAWARTEPRAAPAVPLLEESAAAPPADVQSSMGWVSIALRCAFHALASAPSFEEGLVAVVSRGGDADTNGAIAGALLGAALGGEAIPPRWVESVLRCRSPRPAEYRCGDLRELAEALAR